MAETNPAEQESTLHDASELFIKVELPAQSGAERIAFYDAVEALSHVVMNSGGVIKMGDQNDDTETERVIVNANFDLPITSSDSSQNIPSKLRTALQVLATEFKANVEVSTTSLEDDIARKERQKVLEAYGQGVIEHFSRLRKLLSPRRQETLYHLSKGLSLREAAARMFVSPSTVKTNQEIIGEALGGGGARPHLTAQTLRPDAVLKLADDLGVGLEVERPSNGE